MKAIMRPDKSQFKTYFKLTATGLIYIDLAPYLASGFRQFEALMIGGGGGKAGASSGDSRNIMYGSGGGGGATLHVKTTLDQLGYSQSNKLIPVWVGAGGSAGANVGNGAFGGSGGPGGKSSFGPFTANGGDGALGGRMLVSGGNATDWDPSTGGNGGSNSEGVGSIGHGGEQREYIQGQVLAATQGTWAAGSGSSSRAIGGGGGGGGGYGQLKFANAVENLETAGKPGSVGGDGSYSQAGKAVSGFFGGGGGGGNAKPMLGVDEFYGAGGTTTGGDSGIVVIRIF